MLGNRILRHAHIVSDDPRLSFEVLALDAPSDLSRHSCDFAYNSRLVVHGTFLWTHLISKESLEGWLVNTGLRIFQ